MKLTARLVAVFVGLLAVLVAIDGYLVYAHERALLREAMRQDAKSLGHVLAEVLSDVWSTDGRTRALDLIEDANAGVDYVDVRWIWFDEPDGSSLAPLAGAAAAAVSLERGELVELARPARLLSYYAVETDGARRGGLEVSQAADVLSAWEGRVYTRSALRLLALLCAAAVVVLVVGVRIVGRPLDRLITKVERIAGGDLAEPIVIAGGHELTQLGDSLNKMCDALAEARDRLESESAARIAAIEESRHADRLRTVGQLASGVAHELGTPLNVIGGRAALIEENRLEPEGARESARIIGAQADRMAGIIRQLLAFARRGTGRRSRVNLAQAARESAAMVSSVARQHSVDVRVSGHVGDLAVECDPSALQQVLANLVINAIQASKPGGAVTVDVRSEEAASPEAPAGRPSKCVRVDVRDTGAGIAEEHVGRVFEPFFTTKDVGQGTGLGLSIVHGILSDHGGWITVASQPGGGSCFTFYLPATPA